MEPTDITNGLLEDIRDELRGMRRDQREMRQDLARLRKDFGSPEREAVPRFGGIESVLSELRHEIALVESAVAAYSDLA